MMGKFVELICGNAEFDEDSVLGYSDEELTKIEKLYDIQATGELREFLSEMGRCDGGLIGDDPIIIYKPARSVRVQILSQLIVEEALKNHQKWNWVPKRPFTFSVESETQFFFLLTKSENPDMVYRYDDNRGLILETNLTLFDYLKKLVKFAIANPPKQKVICKGELLTL